MMARKNLSDKEIKKCAKKEKKYIDSLLHKSIKEQNIDLSRSDRLYKFIEDITQLKFDKAFITCFRFFCIFIGILDIILKNYFFGIIMITQTVIFFILDYKKFLFKLKMNKFEEDLDNNLKKIEKQLAIREFIKLLNHVANDDNAEIDFDIEDIINKELKDVNKNN